MDQDRQSAASFGSAVDLLKSDLRGNLVRAGDADYEDTRRVYNAMIDRRPEIIVRCAGVGDVIDAVKFGRRHDLPIAVRGGGHNVTGNALADRGLTIDLSPMKGLRIDPRLRIVRAEAGLTWLEVNHDLQHFGLAAAGGFVGTTGVAGLTLGGGLGWLVRKHGLACDNLVSVDIVTADGRLLQASTEDNPDLFWAVRGGGGNFGIVTSFEFEVHCCSRHLRHHSCRKMSRGNWSSASAGYSPVIWRSGRRCYGHFVTGGSLLRTSSSRCLTAPHRRWLMHSGRTTSRTTGSRIS
ncbi:FAD-binding oxidoreductase [Pseudonocardia halophobica]|uniref:FAD-binding oxidoreductase n=1 Tax=Pseudonocardia halophobica TaxID=29401 RepID=UPI003D94B456